MYPDNYCYWPQFSALTEVEAVDEESKFLESARGILLRKGMKRVGQLLGEELRGQAKLLEDYQDRESQQKLIKAAEFIQDVTEDCTEEYGI
jgi:hypothetical protein